MISIVVRKKYIYYLKFGKKLAQGFVRFVENFLPKKRDGNQTDGPDSSLTSVNEKPIQEATRIFLFN